MKIVGATRLRWGARLEESQSLAKGLASSWDRRGVFWTAREWLRSVGSKGDLCSPTLGVEGSSGHSGALEVVGR